MTVYARDDSAPIVENFREYDPPLEEHLTYTAVGDEKLPAGFTTLKQHAEDRKAHRERADKPVTKTEIDNLNTNAQKEHNMAPATTVHPSTNETQIFDFEGQNVRTVTIDNKPWFVLPDAMKVLGITNTTETKKRLDQADFSTTEVRSGSQNRRVTIVNESGLYDVILDSRKPQAKAFRHWITSEVIPSIRKHGGYLTPEKIEETLLNPDTIIQLAQNLKDEQEKRKATEIQLKAEHKRVQALESYSRGLEDEADVMAPKADAFDAWISGQGVYLLGNAAKIIDQGRNGIGQNRLFKFLREEGILCKGGSRHNVPKQLYAKYFRVKTTTWQTSDGMDRVSMTTYVTPEGLTWIAKRLRSAGFNV